MRVLLLILLSFCFTGNLSAQPSFKSEIAPLLVQHCVGCHGPKKAGGGWRADTFVRLGEAGDSATAGFTDNLDESEAWRRIVSDDENDRMPFEADPLSAEDRAKFKAWIEAKRPFDGLDPQAPLLSYIPPTPHPHPPEIYPATVPVTALAFSPNGNELLAAGYHEVTVWNPKTGQLVRRIQGLPQRIHEIEFSPDGSVVAIAGGNPGRLGEVRLVSSTNGELQRVVGVSSDVVFATAFSPSGDLLATGAADGLIRVLEVATGKEMLAIGSHSDWVFDLAWNSDGSRFASASRDGTSKVFEKATGKLKFSFSGHNSPVHGVIFGSNGKSVISSAENDRVYGWRIEDGKREFELKLGGDGGILVSAGENLLTTGHESRVRLVSRSDLKEVRIFDKLPDQATAAAFDAVHKRVAAGSLDGTVAVWSASDGKEIAKFLAAPGK